MSPEARAALAPLRAGAPLRWSLEALRAGLAPLRPGLGVEWLRETASTNSHLIERARGGDATPCLLVAERQTAGRGRLGRAWISDTDSAEDAPYGPSSLTFSLGLALAPADWSGLSLAVGVALAEALHPDVKLKWPNDLWWTSAGQPGRKLGGVLIETVPLADGSRYGVIGVGINLDAPVPRPELTQLAAGWRELEAQARAPGLLERLAAPLLQAVIAFEQHGFAAFAARFAARDALAGRAVQTTQADAREGRADGVDARGALRVQTAAGLRLIAGGEVSVRPC